MNKQKLKDHLKVSCYDGFTLTDAIRPSLDLQVVPREGYRRDTYRDPNSGLTVPVLIAAVSSERLFDVFLDLLDPLGEVVDVVLETSHDNRGGHHEDLHREQIDLPVLKSYCCDFEPMLMNDGCSGLAVMSCGGPMEVQFDEHKLLVVYAKDLRPFERVLQSYGVRKDDSLKVLTEGEHLHSTEDRYADDFEMLCNRMGVDEPAEQVSW